MEHWDSFMVGFGTRQGQHAGMEGRRFPFLEEESRDYYARDGEIGTNVYEGECQGVDALDWYTPKPVLLRSVNVISNATGERLPDAWQKIMILKPRTLDRLTVGAIIGYGGYKWLIFKTKTYASVQACGIVRKIRNYIEIPERTSIPIAYGAISGLQAGSYAGTEHRYAPKLEDCCAQRNDDTEVLEEGMEVLLNGEHFIVRGLDKYDEDRLMTFTLERPLLEPVTGEVIVPMMGDKGW